MEQLWIFILVLAVLYLLLVFTQRNTPLQEGFLPGLDNLLMGMTLIEYNSPRVGPGVVEHRIDFQKDFGKTFSEVPFVFVQPLQESSETATYAATVKLITRENCVVHLYRVDEPGGEMDYPISLQFFAAQPQSGTPYH